MNKNIQILSFLLLGISQLAFSQIQEERLILDRKRVPEVKKIEKKKTSVETIKNYPPEEKSQTPVNYNITNVPAVSDFKTSTIQGEDISPKFDSEHQRNYFRAGYGNYGRFLADGNISASLENNWEVGADVHFLSTNGLKKDYTWSSKSANANISAFANAYGEKGKLNLTAEYGLNDYNYYGIYALQPDANIDLKQKTNQIKINSFYDFYSNEILNNATVKSSFISDHFDGKESKFGADLNLSKHALELPSDIVMNADLGINMDFQNADFSLLNKHSSNFFNLGASPKLTFYKGNSYLMIGSVFSFLNSKSNSLLQTEELKNNKAYWFPKAEILLAASDEFKFYAGIDGGLKINSYAEMLQENPFLVSDQDLKATETKYHFYFGLKGDISQDLKYDVSAGFGKLRNMMFYKANSIFDNIYSLNRSAYNFANTFSAVYDNGTVSTISGSLQYFPLQNLELDAELHFQKYNLDNYENIYSIPLFNLGIGGKYTMLNKKLNLGAKAFLRTDRTTNSYSISELTDNLGNITYLSTENTDDKVGGYADLNISAEYKFHKNFSIFALGNNLLGAKYQTYKGYKVLGTQFLAGVKISF
ncbi:MAG: TonB-dependent receptor [Cruoricaptor ignavus]|nr:TonB-dependent receptor [Cruoricaptor ignavus]